MSTAFSVKTIEKALAMRPWVRKVRPGVFRVVPKSSASGKYEVTVQGDEILNCRNIHTGDECLGWFFSKNCYHAARVAIHLYRQQEGTK